MRKIIKKSLSNLYRKINVEYPFIGYLIRRLKYKKIFNTIKKKIRGKDNVISYKKSILSSITVEIHGNNNKIEIGESCYLYNVCFFISGDNHSIVIGNGSRFNRGGSLWIEDKNGLIQIGENTTFEDVHLAVTEDNSKIMIGNDCMFAYDIDVRTGDSHSVIDNISRQRINHAKNVMIGNHVWIGAHVSILKGAVVSDNSIVATRTVLTKKFGEPNTVIAGQPGMIVKRNIDWLRERIL